MAFTKQIACFCYSQEASRDMPNFMSNFACFLSKLTLLRLSFSR